MSSRLRDLAEVHYGKSPNEVISEDSTVPIIGTGGIYGQASRSLFNGPAVVVARKGTLGNPQFVDEPFWPVDTTYAVLAKPGVDTKWLYYSLAAFDLTKLNEATGVPSISRDWLYKVSLGSTDFVAQRRIAGILSTLDEAIEQTEALIAKHQQIKAGLLHDLFTRGVTPDGHLRPTREQAPDLYKESPLGWIPKEWEVVSLGEISHSMTNGFVGTATPFYSEDADSVPYLYGNNVRADRLELPTSLRVTRRFHLAQSKSQLSPGDMLTVQSGHIGTSAIVPTELGEANCHALIITKLKTNRVIPGFVSFYCNSTHGFNRLGSIFVGSTIMHINVKEFKNFTIPLPCDLAEQERICTRLVCTINMIDSEAENLAKLRQQKHGLMHDLLTGKVRVKAEQATVELVDG